MLRRILALIVAASLVAWTRFALIQTKTAQAWHATVFEPDRYLQLGELTHYMLLLVLGLPAAFAFALALSDRFASWLVKVLERAGYLVPALCAAIGSFCISHFVTRGAWFTDDEQAYLFQMHGYLRGSLTLPALSPEPLFHHPFVVVSQIRQGVAQWAGTYPILQPLMMAASSLFGSPLLSQWLCSGAIVYNTGKLAEELSGERRLGLYAAWIAAASPMLLGLAATYHTAVLSTLLSLLCLRACLRARERPSFGVGALVGGLAGAVFLTRGLEGALMVVTSAGLLVWWFRSQLRRALPLAQGFALMGAVALAAYLYVNWRSTGDPELTTYAVWAREKGRIMGFGTNLMWGRTHSPQLGLSQTATTLVRMNTWVFGWPTSLAIPLLGLLPTLRSQRSLALLALSAAQLFGYFFLAFGSVHDFGAAYHVWHVPWLAAITVLVIQRGRSYVTHVPRLLLGMTLTGLLALWPTLIVKWGNTARATLAPVEAARAAAHGRKAVVLWSSMHTPNIASWVHFPPAPVPDRAVLWALDAPGAAELVRAALPDRVILRLLWDQGRPRVVELATVP